MLFVAALSAAKATVNRVGGSQVGDFGHSAIPDSSTDGKSPVVVSKIRGE